MENTKETRMLRVQLTEEEQQDVGLRIANLEIEISDIEQEKKAEVEVFNSKIKERSKEALDLSVILTQGWKEKEVECQWINDLPEPGQKSLIRPDLEENNIVETVPMDLLDSAQEPEEEEPSRFDLFKDEFAFLTEGDNEYIEIKEADAVGQGFGDEYNLLKEYFYQKDPDTILIEKADMPDARKIVDGTEEEDSAENAQAEDATPEPTGMIPPETEKPDYTKG